jgi:hypothetical protein
MIDACRIIASGTALTPDNALRAGTCRGEIDAFNWIAPVIGDSSLRACVPTSVTQQQEAKVTVDFPAQNADRIREPFQGLALETLAGIWRCPKTSPGCFAGSGTESPPTDNPEIKQTAHVIFAILDRSLPAGLPRPQPTARLWLRD